MSSSVSDEVVSQFMAFTGSSDPACAIGYLEMSGGDLQTAVGLYMEHEHGGGDGGNGGAAGRDDITGGLASALAGRGGGDYDIRAPDEVRRMRLMDDDQMMPADQGFHMMNAMLEEQFQASAFSAPLAMDVDARAVINAAAESADNDVEAKVIDHDDEYDDDDDDEDMVGGSGPVAPRLSDMFAAPTHLMHKAGGFQGARASAKDSRRWLLVNIQRDSEFSSHALNRDVWRDELVENLVREGFIFWQAMDSSPEGQTYAERYQVQDYPHIAIIDPRTGRLLWRKEGWTQQNPVTAETFSEMAMDFCSRNSFERPPQAPKPLGQSGPSRPTKRSMQDMTEEEQLQAAMRASIEDTATDVATDIVDDDSVEIIPDPMEDAKPQAEEKKKSLFDDLVNVAVGDEPSNGARIQLKMPDGKRLVRKFDSSASVKMIYAFVAQSTDLVQGGKEFVLMVGYPPRNLIDDIDKTIKESRLAGEAVSVRLK